MTATCRQLREPERLVYFLTMEGLLFEVEVRTLESRQVADLVRELGMPKGAQPHFKGAFSAQGRLVVANNTEFPDGFAAHWLRLRALRAGTLTAEIDYS